MDVSKASNQDLSWSQALKTPMEQLSQQVSQAQLQQISPSALAYLGDAVYELYIRMLYLVPPQRLETYHNSVVSSVRAETQAEIMRQLTPYLTNTELEIARKGRNAAYRRPKRVDPHTYQQATSFETLVGYLYLTEQKRLNELLEKICPKK
jgi:ribonuclease-3 family protein